MLLDEHTACWVLRMSMMSTACPSSAAALTRVFLMLRLLLTFEPCAEPDLVEVPYSPRVPTRMSCKAEYASRPGSSERKEAAGDTMGTPQFAEGSCRFKALDQR